MTKTRSQLVTESVTSWLATDMWTPQLRFRVNSTHGQLDTCVELTVCRVDSCVELTLVNSTHGQLDTRIELTEVNSTRVSSWPKSKKTLFQIVYNESNRPIRSWIFLYLYGNLDVVFQLKIIYLNVTHLLHSSQFAITITMTGLRY